MSALSAIGAPGSHGSDAGGAATTDFRGRPRLRLVRQPVAAAAGGRSAVTGGEPRSSSIPPAGVRPTEPTVLPRRAVLTKPVAATEPVVLTGRVLARPGVSRTPVRLTRRGRVVAAALVVAGVTIVVLLASVLASGGAQATNHGQAGAGYRGMHQIVVRPGQTLWSIASAAEPTADTRVVVQQILTANALTGTTITAGQLLWVPR
jgi:hypothetical protein